MYEAGGGYQTSNANSSGQLWDTATGQLIAQLGTAERDPEQIQFVGGGRWITINSRNSTLLIFSARDASLLAKLDLGDKRALQVIASPAGRRLAALLLHYENGNSLSLRIWDTGSWTAKPVTIAPTWGDPGTYQFMTDDLIQCYCGNSGIGDNGQAQFRIHQYGRDEAIAWIDAPPVSFTRTLDLPLLTLKDGRVHTGDGRVLEPSNWQRLRPPPGRKFHPDLVRFSFDGRFVCAQMDGQYALIDTGTEKHFPTHVNWDTANNLPGFGTVTAVKGYGAEVRLLPPADRLDIPPDLLELWAQVAVRGELDPHGEFVKWNEATWEKKRQQLAAVPAPHPDLPFPGNVATDKLHWLRAEFGEAKTDAEKLRLARELLRRAEAAGDRNEAIRWGAEKERREPHVAPPPREVKR